MNKIYTIRFFPTLAPGTNRNAVFQLASYGNDIKIKSVAVDIMIRNTATNEVLPWAQNNVVRFMLFPIDQNIAHLFNPVTGTIGAEYDTGRPFRLTMPRQLYFDSYVISELINWNLYIYNEDLLNIYAVDLSVMVEVELIKR